MVLFGEPEALNKCKMDTHTPKEKKPHLQQLRQLRVWISATRLKLQLNPGQQRIRTRKEGSVSGDKTNGDGELRKGIISFEGKVRIRHDLSKWNKKVTGRETTKR